MSTTHFPRSPHPDVKDLQGEYFSLQIPVSDQGIGIMDGHRHLVCLVVFCIPTGMFLTVNAVLMMDPRSSVEYPVSKVRQTYAYFIAVS